MTSNPNTFQFKIQKLQKNLKIVTLPHKKGRFLWTRKGEAFGGREGSPQQEMGAKAPAIARKELRRSREAQCLSRMGPKYASRAQGARSAPSPLAGEQPRLPRAVAGSELDRTTRAVTLWGRTRLC